MLALQLVLTIGLGVCNSTETIAPGPPVVTGVFPPGIMIGSETTWELTGWRLGDVRAVLCPVPGLRFGTPRPARDGRSLVVDVVAAASAPESFVEVRVESPAGISNLALARIDRLRQLVEVEPNNREPMPGHVIPLGSAVAGVIGPLDVDRFRVEGAPGRQVTLDWESRRLGTTIAPVLSLSGPGHAALGQSRGLIGGDRDCRATVIVPAEGWFEVELRDNTFGGDTRARYRLRVDPEPFATAFFPLGGPAQAPVRVTLGGGNLRVPLEARAGLRPPAGQSWLDDGFFHEPVADLPGTPILGPIFLPGRYRVSNPGWHEPIKPASRPHEEFMLVAGGSTGMTINGRLDHPGAVDRFRVVVSQGDHFRARVEAASAGSWLDSVVTIRDLRGVILAENDDRQTVSPLEPPPTIDGSPTGDSQADYLVAADGPIVVEVSDRAGLGGPEYGYQLELGPPRTDFTIHLLRTPRSADPGPEARSLSEAPAAEDAPGTFGVFNLRPGSTTLVPLVILPKGRPGIIDVEAVDLPPHVQAERLTIRTSPAPRSTARAAVEWDAPAEVHTLRLEAAPDAPPARGRFRVFARNRPIARGETEVVREGDAIVGVDATGTTGRPAIRRLTSFPIHISGAR